MVDYDAHHWLRHILAIRGALIREIGWRVSVCVAWSAVVVYFHLEAFPVSASTVIHSLVGTALGLLLVFRTNASYDRFWEGRKLWGGIVNETRNLLRGAVIQMPKATELHHRLYAWTAMFPHAVTRVLRGQGELGPTAKVLPPEAVQKVSTAANPAVAVSLEMSKVLKDAKDQGLLSDYLQVHLDQNVQQLVDYLGGCERIHKTPLPFAYVVHLRRALIVYCYTLPFALVQSFGWLTVAAVFAVSTIFFGIEEIGVEIEDPFGNDDNDLPLEDISAGIERTLKSMVPTLEPK